MRKSWNGSTWSWFVKTIGGILIFAIVVAGISIYFARQEKPVIYQFNPQKAYIYTEYDDFYQLELPDELQKKVSLFSDGFHPACLFGCRRSMTREEARRAMILGAEKAGEEAEARFAYLDPGEEITISFDMGKGKRIRERYPYVDRLILKLKDAEKASDFSVTASGYEYGPGDKSPSKDSEMERIELSYQGPFGEYSVYSLSNPLYVAQLKLGNPSGIEKPLALKSVSVYLERSGYRSIISSLKSEITEKVARDELLKPDEMIARLEGTYRLDPYSPMTDYLLARLNLNTGNYDSGLDHLQKAASKQEKYGEFLETGLKPKDIYATKARLQKGLGRWEEAIENMKKTAPEIDRSFLSEVYLEKYKESGEKRDLRKSYLNGIISASNTPRNLLSVLEKYRGDRKLLSYGLEYFEAEIKREGETYFLTADGRVSPFMMETGKSLLLLWLGRNGSLAESLSALESLRESSDSKEKKALIGAVESRLYRSLSEGGKAKELKAEALEFFDNYVNLYEDWLGLLGE